MCVLLTSSSTKASSEEVEEHPEHGHEGYGEDRAEEARDLTPDDDGQEDQDRGDLQGLPLNPGRQNVALQ